MRYGIFSDIHSNLQAFEAVIRAFKKEQIDQYVCVGDIVGYGANPHECMSIVMELKAMSVAGNHDWVVLSKASVQYFNPTAKESVFWTRKNVRKEDQTFLENQQLVHKDKDFILVHGTLEEPQYFHYLTDRSQAEQMFMLMDRDICFVGHSHVVGVFVLKDGQIGYSSSVDLVLEKGCRYIVNVGSVGQPRDGNPMAAYCIMDTDKRTIQVKRVNYDVEEAQKRILKAGLPSFLASRLSTGH